MTSKLALATAVVTANGYYIHPIIARIAEDFEVSASTIGLVPAFNQLALALGIFLLLPLGDRFSNRRLISVFVAGQFVGVTVMAFAGELFQPSPIDLSGVGFVYITAPAGRNIGERTPRFRGDRLLDNHAITHCHDITDNAARMPEDRRSWPVGSRCPRIGLRIV